ncbi:MAG: ABC transporter ATP-binding protein [Clostridium sp.]
MITLKNVSKIYGQGEGKFYALKSVDLEIDEGELAVILGPSGSGKSTLLNIIGGIDKCDEGEVNSFNVQLNSTNDDELTDYRAENVGFIFQFYNLIPNLTVEENIQVVREISEKPFTIDEVLKAVNLLEQRKKFPNQLSGGQQQRVAIARALVKNPKLLLCDEPTGALDYNTSKEVLSLLSKVNKEYKTTIIIITHNNSIANMGDRIIKVRSGEVTSNFLNHSKIGAEEVQW